MTRSKYQALQQAILSWFQQHERNLPWRQTNDPYHILVSEVMLQQTQVDRVIPKYHQFLEAFPTVEALAKSPTAEVIKLWFPLGYNRRPVRLKAIAQAVVDNYGGQFPATYQELLGLRGVGPYTAGAIMCFAYQADAAIIDTNIRRIIHRWLVGSDIPKSQASDRQLHALAEQVLPKGQGYAWNQALMDFGSAICTSRQPKCQDCPVKELCAAYPAISTASPRQRAKGQKFEESNRYFRGRIVRLLSETIQGSLTVEQLSSKLGDEKKVDQARLQALLEQLAADQLIQFDPDHQIASLPD